MKLLIPGAWQVEKAFLQDSRGRDMGSLVTTNHFQKCHKYLYELRSSKVFQHKMWLLECVYSKWLNRSSTYYNWISKFTRHASSCVTSRSLQSMEKYLVGHCAWMFISCLSLCPIVYFSLKDLTQVVSWLTLKREEFKFLILQWRW